MSENAGPQIPRPRRRISCGTIALVALAIAFALFVYSASWFVGRGEQYPTLSIVGPEAAAVAHFTDLGRDRGVRQLYRHFMRISEEQAFAEDPSVPKVLTRFLELTRPIRHNIGPTIWLIPTEITHIQTGAKDDSVDESSPTVLAIRLRRFVKPIRRVFRMILRRDRSFEQRSYRDQPVYATGNELFAFVGATLVITGNEALLNTTIDRLLEGPETLVPGELPLLESDEWDIVGRSSGFSTLPELLRFRDAGADADTDTEDEIELIGDESVENIIYAFDMVSGDELRGILQMSMNSPENAKALEAELISASEDFRTELEDKGASVSISTHIDGSRLELQLNVTGMLETMTRMVHEASERTHSPSPTQTGEPELEPSDESMDEERRE